MSEERLNRFLARTGVASRRACDKLIQQGVIQVNGVTVAEPGTRIDPLADEVRYGGQVVRPPDACTYVVLNKPAGYLVSAGDPHHSRTVFDLLDGVDVRLFPVGRLDMDTTGVLLLTDDGDLAHRLTHPKFGVEKTYVAEVAGIVGEDALQNLRDGVLLDDGRTSPARARVVAIRQDTTKLELTIHEGRNRQVKRMCEAIGHRVRRLERTCFGPLRAKGLRRGQWRPLSGDEVRGLERVSGLNPPV